MAEVKPSVNAIEVTSLTKKFGRLTAVNNISFSVKKGSTFAFLGTNGAGKSTTINCLTTVLKPSGGEAIINGFKLGQHDDAIRNSIGVVFQQSLLDPILTIKENLQLRAKFYGLKNIDQRIAELSNLIGLDDFLNQAYGKLSGGQKRRADIVRALLHNPEILFLDEPSAGLDPESRENVWKAVYSLQKSLKLSVFLTTHYMEETERADDVCIINKGVIVAQGSPSFLRAKHSRDELRVTAKDALTLGSKLKKLHPSTTKKGNDLYIRLDSSAEAMALLKQIESQISDFEFRHGTMDDVFLELVGTKSKGATK